MTKEQIDSTIAHLDFNQLSIRVAAARNAARIRAINTSLAQIAQFKPQHCDCACATVIDIASFGKELALTSGNGSNAMAASTPMKKMAG